MPLLSESYQQKIVNVQIRGKHKSFHQRNIGVNKCLERIIALRACQNVSSKTVKTQTKSKIC